MSDEFGELVLAVSNDGYTGALWEAAGSKSRNLLGRFMSLRLTLPEGTVCHGSLSFRRRRLSGAFSNVLPIPMPGQPLSGTALPGALDTLAVIPVGTEIVDGSVLLDIMPDRSLSGQILVERSRLGQSPTARRFGLPHSADRGNWTSVTFWRAPGNESDGVAN